jgi:Protein of unknown function (DUF3592)
MGLLPDGEVLRTPRRNALAPLLIGLVFAGVGVWVMRIMSAKGDAGAFMYIWGSIWFLGSGAAILSGLRGLFSPPIFATLTHEGVSFPQQHLRLIPWRDLAAVRLGLRTVTRNRKTHTSFRTPLILTVRDAGILKGDWKGFQFTHHGHALDDGTAELLLKTDGCPLTNEALITRLSERIGTLPDLRPADPETATLGGVKLNQPARHGWGSYAAAAVFLAFGLAFTGIGVTKLIQAHDSQHWLPTEARILSAKVETSSGGAKGNSTTFTPRIRYTYVVADQTFTSNRAAFIYESSFAKAQTFLRRYPVGSKTTAYYDPENPSEAVLTRDGHGKLWTFIAFGSVFVLLGAWRLQRLTSARTKTTS